jgi:hypothetical membrane protein
MENFAELFMRNFQYFGLAGVFLITAVVIFSGLSYCGKKNEPFSIFNHFISELGEVGVSRQAHIFNLGLILSGISLLPFVIGLGFYLDNFWAKLGGVAGLWAAVSCACVGFYPMNNLTSHNRAAISYFRAGLATVLLFGISILVQPAEHTLISQYANIVSLLAVISYATFLILLTRSSVGKKESNNLDPEAIKERPRFWLLPFLEWLVFFSTILWFFGIALVV